MAADRIDDVLELHRRAAGHFGEKVLAVGEDQWHLPTPCSEWDVHQLVNHVVYENRWAVDLVAGKTVAEVGDRHEGDLLGDDPVSAWHESLAAAREALDEPGVLDRTVHLSYGDETATEYFTQLVTDLVVHGWDLARAIGADEEMDAELAGFVWQAWKDREDMVRGSGMFGEHLDVPADADTQTKLLALLGRRA
jgi:uncharacterized protein (TIGR03086 family)